MAIETCLTFDFVKLAPDQLAIGLAEGEQQHGGALRAGQFAIILGIVAELQALSDGCHGLRSNIRVHGPDRGIRRPPAACAARVPHCRTLISIRIVNKFAPLTMTILVIRLLRRAANCAR